MDDKMIDMDTMQNHHYKIWDHHDMYNWIISLNKMIG